MKMKESALPAEPGSPCRGHVKAVDWKPNWLLAHLGGDHQIDSSAAVESRATDYRGDNE